jgi:hypothetical protein
MNVSPAVTWNKFIESLLLTKKAWEVHREVMESKPDIDALGIEVSRKLRYPEIHRASDFERAMLNLINRARMSGGLDEMLIPGIKLDIEKETKDGSRKK